MKIQHDIPTELNKKLKVYRIEKGFKNLSEAIHFILNKFFEVSKK